MSVVHWSGNPTVSFPIDVTLSHITGSPSELGDVDSGAEVYITVRLTNHAQAIFATDPDRCDNPANPCQSDGSTAGYCAEPLTRPEWAPVREDLSCVNLALLLPNRKDVTVALPAPGWEGDFDIATQLEWAASAERTQEIVKTISYREGGSTASPPPDDEEEEDVFLEEATALVGAIGATLSILVVLVGLIAISKDPGSRDVYRAIIL